MDFKQIYASSVNASSLRDDNHHHKCESLAASGWAGRYRSGLGAILLRLKTCDGTAHKIFESGARNLGPALRIWIPLVKSKGQDRKWMEPHTPREEIQAEALYRRVAEASLAYWMDSRCPVCEGAKQDSDRRRCEPCKGTGVMELLMGRFDKNITLDLVSELEDLMASHARAAHGMMRKGESQ